MRHSRSAFTLVELSIVLVILGLLVGGVLAGQSLIKAAELRAVSTEYSNFNVALNAFREKYKAVPGDMVNAVWYWGSAGGGTADGTNAICMGRNHTYVAVGTETCNGNGDGRIGGGGGEMKHEWFRFWQHLKNAGLIEGTFTGVNAQPGTYDSQPGLNIPKSRFPNAGWSVRTGYPFQAGTSRMLPADYDNLLFLGAYTVDDMVWNPVMQAEDAYNIDMKSDDGRPHTGRIMSGSHTGYSNCINVAEDAYELSNGSKGCILIFFTDM